MRFSGMLRREQRKAYTFKAHLNFMPTPSVMNPFKKELAQYATGKGSIQLPYDKRLPKALIRRIAARRVKQLREKDVSWM